MKAKDNSKLNEAVKKLEQTEYGTKELIHGLLIGVIVGFTLALFLLK